MVSRLWGLLDPCPNEKSPRTMGIPRKLVFVSGIVVPVAFRTHEHLRNALIHGRAPAIASNLKSFRPT